MPKITVDYLKSREAVVLNYTVYGNKTGVPLVYLHGGPGDAVTPSFKRQFDASVYRVILYDQRGCGKSTPRNHLEKNTTSLLLSDLEKLREHLGVDKWVVAGGSWGSSLALLYAEKWPDRVLGLLLRGVYDLSLDNCVLNSVYPESKEVLDSIASRKNFNKTASKILSGKKNATRRKLIETMESNDPLYVNQPPGKDSFKTQETLALIGHHYEAHHFFMPKNAVYKGLAKIKHIPIIMVQGRYDVVTPMNIAYGISKKLPLCELRVIRAGHTMHETAIMKALKTASTDLALKLK